MTEQSLHLWHQFSQQTKNKHSRSQQGSVSIFAITWIALTVVCCSVIVLATSFVQQRAHLQEAADAIALAAVSSDQCAHDLANTFHVKIRTISRQERLVNVAVFNSFGTATSGAQ